MRRNRLILASLLFNLVNLVTPVSLGVPVRFALAAPSTTPPDLTLTVESKEVAFYRIPQSRLLATNACLQSQPCQGQTASKKATTVGLNLDRGVNAGAMICQQIGGSVTLGLDAKRNQYSLCAFSDKSMLTSGSLYSEAIENDLNSTPKKN